MDEFEYEEVQWTEEGFNEAYEYWHGYDEHFWIPDQKFMDTLAWIASLPETLPF